MLHKVQRSNKYVNLMNFLNENDKITFISALECKYRKVILSNVMAQWHSS